MWLDFPGNAHDTVVETSPPVIPQKEQLSFALPQSNSYSNLKRKKVSRDMIVEMIAKTSGTERVEGEECAKWAANVADGDCVKGVASIKTKDRKQSGLFNPFGT